MRPLFVCLVLLLAQIPMSAQQRGGGGLQFQATLESIKITARPGQVITRQFRLTLDKAQKPTHFRARIEDWWRSEDGKQSFYAAPGTLRRSCGRWVSLNPVQAVGQPGEPLIIRITVSLPSELPVGGYWCVLTVDEVPDPLAAGQAAIGVKFVASVSTGIFVYVEPVQREAKILELTIVGEETRVKVRNGGNAPLGIEGRIEFLTVGGTTPAAVSTVSRTTVLPEPITDGVLTSRLPAMAQLPSGRYRVRAILDFGADHYLGAEREISIVRAVPSSGRR